MVYKPRTVDQIYESLKTGLEGRISGLTNFVTTSFNYVWTRSFARKFRDNEIALLAAQLSGWVDYAGGPIDQSDLSSLGIENVDAGAVNDFMEDQDLDNISSLVGIERSDGTFATGDVTFTTVSSETPIEAGTVVSTQPDEQGDVLEFSTDEAVKSVSGDTTVSVSVTAEQRGDEYNIGSGSITYLVDPPIGVKSVTNTAATSGGDDRETNDEFRTRIKNAIFSQSGGGTANGVRGFVEENTENISSVAVKEYFGGNATLAADSPSPGGPGGSNSDTPFADVICEGPNTQEFKDEAITNIEESRPVSIQHNFVRPNDIEVKIDATVTGSNIQTGDIDTQIVQYLSALELGEDVNRDRLIQTIMNADTDVTGIETLEISVENESITFDNTVDVYSLNKGVQMVNDGITNVTGFVSGSNVTFVEDTDYQEIDDDTDGSDDAIDWSLAGDDPDDGTEFSVTYRVDDDIPINEYEKTLAGSITVNTV